MDTMPQLATAASKRKPSPAAATARRGRKRWTHEWLYEARPVMDRWQHTVHPLLVVYDVIHYLAHMQRSEDYLAHMQRSEAYERNNRQQPTRRTAQPKQRST
uniref:Uncharacterized protein n=1 Tax=Aegilops tauschii TaxID=37682 RepID=M8C8P1_AEGTA